MKALAAKVSDTLFLRSLRAAAPASKASRRATTRYGHVILAPSSRGNLGDEAMLTASLGEIRARSEKEITVLTHTNTDDWSDIAPGITQISIQGYFSPLKFKQPISRLVDVFSQATSFSILGADVMDGAYSRSRTLRRIAMADLATQFNITTRILGFSYSDKCNAETHAYLARVSSGMTLNARDIKSYERLRAMARGPVKHVADTAFLLQPADPAGHTAQKALEFITRHKADKNKVIAFNANPLGTSMSAGAKKGSESMGNLDDLVARQVTHILTRDPNVVLVFVPHDPREPHNDRALLQRTYDAQNPAHKERIFLAFEGISARDVKSICKDSDLTVTGRMHMGIASLGAKTPALFLDFQGKVRGLLAHFDIPELYFDWELYQQPEKFAKFVLSTLENVPKYRLRIEAKHPAVIELSRINFSDFS